MSKALDWFNGITSCIGSIGGLITGAITAKKNLQLQRETNELNAQLTRETNELNAQQNQMNRDFSEAEAQKARDFTLSMYNKENAYNTPAAQVARYKAAGLNPALAMGNISAGTASSGGTSQASAPGSTPMSAPQYQAPQLDTSGLQNAFQNLMTPINESLLASANHSKINSEIGNLGLIGEGISLDNAYKRKQNEYFAKYQPQIIETNLAKIRGDTNHAAATGIYRKLAEANAISEYNLNYNIRNQTLRNMEWNEMVQSAQRTGIMLDNEAKRTLNKYGDANAQADLIVKMQAIILGGLQANKTAQEIQGLVYDNALKDLNVKEREQVFQSMVDAMIAENEYKQEYFSTGIDYVGEEFEHESRRRSAEQSAWDLDAKYAEKFKAQELKNLKIKGVSDAVGSAVGAIGSVLIPGAGAFGILKGLKGLKGLSVFKKSAPAFKENYY